MSPASDPTTPRAVGADEPELVMADPAPLAPTVRTGIDALQLHQPLNTPTDAEALLLARVFRALGHATRLRILLILRDGPITLPALTQQLGLHDENIVRKHVYALRDVGVIAPPTLPRTGIRLEPGALALIAEHLARW
ncbi:helix-turn-helix domain-containing protein [Luteipulveratus sp. YIM 133132]|uniref:ArsR/SmtB family transcription factor n=1 Tax=Luteipulveratus flavus TaxID=3031728 RepID=UPI0023AFEBF9|nr:helix-turn-helix domain-containing protein [Luteipulveratus sp. YIM 133132]MDE9364005.1 helix-turn-helix domain-containing protein [Luteipulveratus sp. YIM 133132]